MEVTTGRFLLREFTEADAAQFVAYHEDPRYLAFSSARDASPQRSRGLLAMFHDWAREQPRRHYQFAIAAVYTPALLLGCCGLRGIEDRVAEIGIELAPRYWGRHGCALEVMCALIEFGFRDLELNEICGETVSANDRIARLATWLGFTSARRDGAPEWMQGRGWHEVEWRLPSEAWHAQRKHRARRSISARNLEPR